MPSIGRRAAKRISARTRAVDGIVLPARLRRALLAWRYPDGPDRLVRSPVFLFSPVRSGSTLLRVLLNTHSQICAPHEMHLNRLRITASQRYLRRSLKELGFTTRDLEDLLWDRVLHRQLVSAQKSIVVDKTPQNLALWPRIARSWPHARYLFLVRHPAAITHSLAKARPDVPLLEHASWILKYGSQLNDARSHLPGLTVRYEELTADPEAATRRICSWLGVRWERAMLDYGRVSHGRYVAGIGDWSENIRSGKIQQARPLPPASEVTPLLQPLAADWGY